jgi:hypothetical protein
MKRILLAVAAAALLASCAGAPPVIPPEASAQEIVQRAQEAADRYAWEAAVTWYQALLDRFGTDPAYLCAGEYEIALIRSKQGRWQESKDLLDRLLARYADPSLAPALPPRYKILALKVLPTVEEKLGVAPKAKPAP